MVRTKLPVLSARTPSRGSGRGKRRRGEEEGEVQSQKRRIDNYTFKVLFNINVKAYERYENVYDGKKILKGRIYDFHQLGDYPGNADLEVSKWLIAQGWKEHFSYQGPTYPRLVQVLMTNYSPSTKTSWIGKTTIDLSPQSLRDILGIVYEAEGEDEEEEEFEWPRKEILFDELAKEHLTTPHVYLPAHMLGLDLKLAHLVICHMIHPKLGSSDQVPEKDAKILWALEKGKKLDLAQIMSDHLSFVKSNPKMPLPYGMYFTKVFEKFKIDVSKEHAEHFKDGDIINMKTVKKMGFRNVGGEWVFRRGKSKEKSPQREEEIEEEEEEEGREEPRDTLLDEVMRSVEEHLPPAQEEATAAQPSTAEPTTSHTPHPRPSSQPIPSNLTALKTFITSSLSKLETTLTSQLQSLSQRVDNLEVSLHFKLDTLISLVESTQPPDPSAKRKGIAIPGTSRSSSTQPFYPSQRSPARPFNDPTSGPSTSRPQPSPQPTLQTTPQPSTSPHPTPQQTQAISHTSHEAASPKSPTPHSTPK